MRAGSPHGQRHVQNRFAAGAGLEPGGLGDERLADAGLADQQHGTRIVEPLQAVEPAPKLRLATEWIGSDVLVGPGFRRIDSEQIFLVALRRMASFPLMTNGEHQHDILLLLMDIERHIATLTVGDQDFSQPRLTWSADQRVSLKNLDPVSNDVNRRNGGLCCILSEKISQSLQVGKGVSGVNYFRHVRTFGRATRSPRTRAAI